MLDLLTHLPALPGGGSCVNEMKNITDITRSSDMTKNFKQNVLLFYKLPGNLFQSPSQLL